MSNTPSTWDKISDVTGSVGKMIVIAIWLVGGVAVIAGGQVLLGLVAFAYVAYLMFFGGRWLIY